MLYNGLGTGAFSLLTHLVMGILKPLGFFTNVQVNLMTEEEKRLAGRVSILQGLLPSFVCAIYNGQARDWDREKVFSMLTNKDDLKGEDLPARLTEDDVSAYINKLFAQHESKTHT